MTTPAPARRTRDGGYAMVAAVASLAAIALIAYAVAAGDRGAVARLSGEQARARMDVAAEAGLALAVQGLAASDPAERWAIDRRVQRRSFDGVTLDISVEDERGKIALVDLDDRRALRLFEALGLEGDRAQSLADALLDWMDEDDDPRPHGAEAPFYAARGVTIRNGFPPTLDELGRVRGMTPDLLARLEPVLSAHYGDTGGFDARTASPVALSVMSEAGDASPDAVQRKREVEEDERPAFAETAPTLVGRSLTVRVAAQGADGARLTRSWLIEMTGRDAPPFVVREAH